MTFTLTPRQVEANRLLGSSAAHCALVGGSRSGKTLLIMRAIVTRALAYQSRHAVLRFRFNHLKGSIIYDTLPKVMELCFPGVADKCHLDKSDWFYMLPNGSEIWFGGLDDKQRTEKILGQEHSTIFLNECSQIPWPSRNMAVTRLAQRSGLRLKMYYDMNPPSDAHWTFQVFVKKADPDTRKPYADPQNYASIRINPKDNEPNLGVGYLKSLEELPERMRRRFLLGEFVSATENALWSFETLDRYREPPPQDSLQRIVIAVDPSGCSGPEDERSDEIGIMVCGLSSDGNGYVLEDLSGRFGPSQWGQVVASAFDRWEADCVVAEVNYGGAMVREVLRAARPRTPFREVHASRGKHIRAEPIAMLFEQGKFRLGGNFPKLEDQMISTTTAGFMGDKSPDRMDAMVWAATELFPALASSRKPGAAKPPVPKRLPELASPNGWMG